MRISPKAMMAAMTAVVALAGAPAMAEIKIGVLDFGRLMDESPQGKTLIDSLRSEAAAKQRELQTQATSLQGKRDKLGKDRATMTPEQISRAEKDLRDGERDLARRQAEINDDFNARRNEEMSKLQRTLIEEVRTFSKAQNFDLVVTDGVIYATQALDITPAVLAGLQQRNGGGAAAAAKPATR
ncbi:MAG: OmpH family outer membrane protein [Gammaproteobacteria bacterium]|nr:OmpH family outer membrane protein [Gammaproteobacteria bacterium]